MILRPEIFSWQIANCTWRERQTTDSENEFSIETVTAGYQIAAASDCISKPIRSF